MPNDAIAKKARRLLEVTDPVIQFLEHSRWAREAGSQPEASDFTLGNPHEMPLSDFPAALQKWSVPQNQDWFAYKMSEPESQEIVAASLRRSHGLDFEPEDITMTNGAFAALAASLAAITDPGDEVIYISPPWFFYETMILANDGQAVRVPADRNTFDLDLAGIEAALTRRTRAIIINSPNNPTGRIYPPETLRALAALLAEGSQRSGRTIYLLSDESYNHIVYDGRSFPSPVAFYPHSFLVYTYGKTLLTPGQRIGYIALPPQMLNRQEVREGLQIAQLANGYTYPNALLQHALPDLEKLSIDIGALQARRDRLATALRGMDYTVNVPEGTFYLLVRSPLPDDLAFIDLLADEQIYCLPGSVFELPGYFRISLTASEAMIERALPGFERALSQARAGF